MPLLAPSPRGVCRERLSYDSNCVARPMLKAVRDLLMEPTKPRISDNAESPAKKTQTPANSLNSEASFGLSV